MSGIAKIRGMWAALGWEVMVCLHRQGWNLLVPKEKTGEMRASQWWRAVAGNVRAWPGCPAAVLSRGHCGSEIHPRQRLHSNFSALTLFQCTMHVSILSALYVIFTSTAFILHSICRVHFTRRVHRLQCVARHICGHCPLMNCAEPALCLVYCVLSS